MPDFNVSVGCCTADDIEDVVRFIDENWKHGHILTRSRALLDWQHRDADGGYSFVIARRDGQLVAILGYIATRRFDPALSDHSVVWLTMWRVLEDAGVTGLGLALLQHLARIEPHRAIGALGLNPTTAPIYRALGYRVGELQHYVRPNSAVARFELARLTTPARPIRPDAAMTASSISDEREFDALDGAFDSLVQTPTKTARYFFTRYSRHPVYAYRVLALRDRHTIVGLLAARVAEHGGRSALRIVDLLAPVSAIGRIGGVVDSLVRDTGAEYADFYNAGIDPDVLVGAGFTRVDPDGPDLVPDHFEPFEPINIRLWYAFTGDPILFKGDADQDRPSLVSDVRP